MYKTLNELKDAYASGAVPSDATIVIDNDTTNLYVHYADDVDDSECVFEMHPGTLLEEALDLLGVPWEGV